MAEKYGTIPPRFTREWWGYVWEYYKFHIACALFALFFVISFAHSCASEVKYDVSVVHMSSTVLGEDCSAALDAALKDKIADIDSNDEKNIEFISLTKTGTPGFEEQDMAMQAKFFLTFSHDTTYLYLVDEAQCRELHQEDRLGEFFLPIDEWGIDAEKNLSPEDGGDYGIALDDNTYLKEKGCLTKGLRLMIKPPQTDDETGKAAFENAKIIAKELIK